MVVPKRVAAEISTRFFTTNSPCIMSRNGLPSRKMTSGRTTKARKGSYHLQRERRPREPERPSEQQHRADEDLEEAQRRHEQIGVDPRDDVGDELHHRRAVEHLQETEPSGRE
jgi:hypothetical protein